jgi:hypothetical protein
MADAKPIALTADRLREVPSYDPETGVFTWRVRPSPRSRVRAGDVAGVVGPDGYRIITIEGVSYYAHRLAMLYMNGEWPEHDTDHRNLNRDNNKWGNLRAATDQQNAANRPRIKISRSGLKGVIWYKRDQRWMARIKVNNRLIFLGYFDDPKDAHSAYFSAAERYFGEFARAA